MKLIFLFLFFLRYMNRYFIFSWSKSEMGDSFKFVIFSWNKISRFIFTVIRMADFHYDMTDSISYSCIFVYLSFYRIFDLILLCFDIPSRRFYHLTTLYITHLLCYFYVFFVIYILVLSC